MSAREIADAVMELPEKERLELARRIVAGVVEECKISKKLLLPFRELRILSRANSPG